MSKNGFDSKRRERLYICVFGHGMSVCICVHDLCRIHVQVCIWCKMLWVLSENEIE